MLADPRFVETQCVEMLEEFEITLTALPDRIDQPSAIPASLVCGLTSSVPLLIAARIAQAPVRH